MASLTTPKDTLNRRLDEIGWGLFFLMTGGLLLAPQKIPDGTWLIGVGIIMLGINGARRLYGIPISLFTVVVGIVAVAAGVGDFLGLKLPLFAALFILIGAGIIVRQLLQKAT